MGYAELTPFLIQLTSIILSHLGDTFFATLFFIMNYQMSIIFLGTYMTNFILPVLTGTLGLFPQILNVTFCVSLFWTISVKKTMGYRKDDNDEEGEVKIIEELDKGNQNQTKSQYHTRCEIQISLNQHFLSENFVQKQIKLYMKLELALKIIISFGLI